MPFVRIFGSGLVHSILTLIACSRALASQELSLGVFMLFYQASTADLSIHVRTLSPKAHVSVSLHRLAGGRTGPGYSLLHFDCQEDSSSWP